MVKHCEVLEYFKSTMIRKIAYTSIGTIMSVLVFAGKFFYLFCSQLWAWRCWSLLESKGSENTGQFSGQSQGFTSLSAFADLVHPTQDIKM